MKDSQLFYAHVWLAPSAISPGSVITKGTYLHGYLGQFLE